MKVNFSEGFIFKLNNQIDYIAADKPIAARKFKRDLVEKLKKDLKQPFLFKKSRYYNDENIRDYIFKGYTVVYYIDTMKKSVSVFGFIKHKHTL
jgi:plasmid stabilization system protein ParE